MTSPDVRQAPERKWLRVSVKTHAAVSSMQKDLEEHLGYRVTASEAVKRGMEALEREMEEER